MLLELDYNILMPITYSISAMDTLSSNTAGVDAAKGKTLEEMSDLVQQVNSIHGLTFIIICFFLISLQPLFSVVDNENRRKKGPTCANNQRAAAVASKGTRDSSGT